jgi:hypothetical protein
MWRPTPVPIRIPLKPRQQAIKETRDESRRINSEPARLAISTFPRFPHKKSWAIRLTARESGVTNVSSERFSHLILSSAASEGLTSYTEADDGTASTRLETIRRSRRDARLVRIFRTRPSSGPPEEEARRGSGITKRACCGQLRPVKRKSARQLLSFATEDKGRAIAPFLFVTAFTPPFHRPDP